MPDNKILERLSKVKRQRDSAFDIESFGEAENFDVYLKQQLKKYNLSEDELDDFEKGNEANPFTENIINELGKTIIVNPFLRVNAKNNMRIDWFEKLAELVGSHYGCITNIRIKSGEISFYGYDLDRELGSFMFLKIADLAYNNAKTEFKRLKPLVGAVNPLKQNKTYLKEWMGDDVFEFSFHSGFRQAIKEIYSLNNRVIDIQVKTYFDLNKNSDVDNSSYYQQYYPTQKVEELIIDDMVFELGRRYGHDSITKSQSNQLNMGSQLVSTRVPTKYQTIIDNKNKLLILIDNSGSMWESKLNQAKAGAIEFARKSLEQDYSVGVITFETNCNYLIKFTDKIDEKFEKKINKIESKGGTNLTDAIKMATCYFTNSRVKRTIMIVTDGMPNNPITALEAAKDAKRLGIKIMIIGTDDAKQEFLDQLVSEEGLGQLVASSRLQLGMGEMAAKL